MINLELADLQRLNDSLRGRIELHQRSTMMLDTFSEMGQLFAAQQRAILEPVSNQIGQRMSEAAARRNDSREVILRESRTFTQALRRWLEAI